MLRAVSFSKTYASAKKPACANIDFAAERGKITVLLGPNGAGKSTLLKALCASHYATSGHILAERNDGAIFDAAQNPDEVKAIAGFVSEVPALYDDWTVEEFLEAAASLRVAESEGATITQAAKKAARLCNLGSVLNQKISSLSHGYRQRVNFAQALVHDPQILILDEPATGLDPEQIRECRELVQSLKSGRALVFSTHIIQEAEALADVIYIVKDGTIAASGSPAQLIKASGKSSLEDAYLFFAKTGAASSNLRAPTAAGIATDSTAWKAAAVSGLANDSSTTTDSTPKNAAPSPRLASAPRGLLRLVQKELYAYAINPFYWLCAALFCAFSAAAYFYGTRFFVQGQGSAALSPFFLAMPYVLSVLIPAFCLNIKSRAFDATLPFGEFKKAAARVLAGLAVFVLYLLPTIFVPVCVSLFGSVDAGAVLVSYLGLLFFYAAAVSFCVFLSSLFASRAAYFAVSVLALFAVNALHGAQNFIPLSDSLSSALRSISFAWRFDSASKGILDTRDFFFFALAALVFLTLASFVSERRKGRKYFCKGRALRSWTIIFVLVFLALDAGRLYKRFDFSAGKNYTPSERTKNLLASADEKVRISYYRSAELLKLYPQVRDVGDFLRSLSFSCKNVVYSEYDADRPAAQKILAGLSVPPFQIQKQKNNSLEFADTYSAVVLDYMDRTLFIPAAFSAFGLEYDLNLRLDYLLNKKSRAAYVLCSEGMSLQKDFKAALDWLNVEGFETRSLSLRDLSASSGEGGLSLDPKIPLVLFGTSALDADACGALENFLDAGGSLFVAASPYSANVDGDWSLQKNKRDFLLPLLERRGISFLDSVAADISCVRANFRSAENGGQEKNTSVNYPLWISVLPQTAAPYGATVFWASPILLDKKMAEPLLVSSPASWRFLPDKKSGGPLFDTNPFTVPKAAVSDPLVQKEASVLAARTLDKKIVAVSGGLFANDLLLTLAGGETGDFRNLNFLTTSLLELCGESDMAALKNKGAADTSLWKITDALEWDAAKNFSLLATLFLAPAVPLLFCALFFRWRRRRTR